MNPPVSDDASPRQAGGLPRDYPRAYHACTLSGPEDQVLETALQLGLLTQIAAVGAGTSTALARRCRCPEEGIKVLLGALHAMGMVDCQDGKLFRLTQDGDRLAGMKRELLIWRRYEQQRWKQLTRVIRKGRGAEGRDYWMGGGPRTRAFIYGMAAMAERLEEKVRSLSIGQARHLLDLGSGPGLHAVAFKKVHPDLKITLLIYA